jgi:hypothetical protein
VEFGCVVGGSERSWLTFGAVLGGGGTALVLREDAEDGGGICGSSIPCGIVIEPTPLRAEHAFVAVEPFVSFQVQPLRFLGFELHLGCLVPLFDAAWGDPTLSDVPNDLAGPVVGLSLTWGAVGRPPLGRGVAEETVERTIELVGPCVTIDNAVGQIVVAADPARGVQTGSAVVDVVAVKRGPSQERLQRVDVLIEPTECGVWIHSEGPQRMTCAVDYTITVPAGIVLDLRQGAGSVRLDDVSGSARIELGVGEVAVDGFRGSELTIEGGVGSTRVVDSTATSTEINVGVGEVHASLPEPASYGVHTNVGIGGITIGSFLGNDPMHRGGFGADIDTVIGAGENALTIGVGIGEIDIEAMRD